MGVYCGKCEHAKDCAEHPETYKDCQDNAARFAPPVSPAVAKMNAKRADRARAALLTYSGSTSERYPDNMTAELWNDYASDLLADLLHLGDRLGYSLQDAYDSAERNHHAEAIEPDDLSEDYARIEAENEPEPVSCPECGANLAEYGAVNFSESSNGTASAVDGTWSGPETTENVYDLSLSCSQCGADVYATVLEGEQAEPRPFEDCDRPCSIECDRMTCARDED